MLMFANSFHLTPSTQFFGRANGTSHFRLFLSMRSTEVCDSGHPLYFSVDGLDNVQINSSEILADCLLSCAVSLRSHLSPIVKRCGLAAHHLLGECTNGTSVCCSLLFAQCFPYLTLFARPETRHSKALSSRPTVSRCSVTYLLYLQCATPISGPQVTCHCITMGIGLFTDKALSPFLCRSLPDSGTHQ